MTLFEKSFKTPLRGPVTKNVSLEKIIGSTRGCDENAFNEGRPIAKSKPTQANRGASLVVNDEIKKLSVFVFIVRSHYIV